MKPLCSTTLVHRKMRANQIAPAQQSRALFHPTPALQNITTSKAAELPSPLSVLAEPPRTGQETEVHTRLGPATRANFLFIFSVVAEPRNEQNKERHLHLIRIYDTTDTF